MRYFIEVAYKGTAYAGFQMQQNANTIQAEVEKALKTYYRQTIPLTGSSRTDAGVHAAQNYFHFDTNIPITNPNKSNYHLNAILPPDIVIHNIIEVAENAHCRFDAQSRTYQYTIYQSKNPFLQDTGYYFPYPLNLNALQEAAESLKNYTSFESFSKKNTQVFTYNCTIIHSHWQQTQLAYIYTVTANRFLRGMVRGLVGTMLQVGKGKISVADFIQIIESKNAAKTDFSTPAHGLILQNVQYPYL